MMENAQVLKALFCMLRLCGEPFKDHIPVVIGVRGMRTEGLREIPKNQVERPEGPHPAHGPEVPHPCSNSTTLVHSTGFVQKVHMEGGETCLDSFAAPKQSWNSCY